jgi:hypothetical protein
MSHHHIEKSGHNAILENFIETLSEKITLDIGKTHNAIMKKIIEMLLYIGKTLDAILKKY